MLAYRLRHRVAFQEQQVGQNPETGAPVITWVNAFANGIELSSVPAEVLTGAGRELMAAGAKQAETTARINLRWFPGLKQSWRILWDDRVYNITGMATDITARQEWRLQCTDGVNDGQ